MKKKILIIGIVLIILLICALTIILNKKNEENKDIGYVEKIYEVNTLDARLESHSNAYVEASYYDINGEVTDTYTYYGEKDLLIYEDGLEAPIINTSTEEFGYTTENIIYKALFIDASYETYLKELRDHCFMDYFEGIEFVSKKEKDNSYVIECNVPMESVSYLYSEDELFEDSENLKMYYTINKENYEIQHVEEYFVIPDKGEIKWLEINISYDVEKQEIPNELAVSASGTERTVTIIENADTENEKRYLMTASKGTMILPYLSTEYRNLYLDKECTQKYTGENDYSTDAIYYICKGK